LHDFRRGPVNVADYEVLDLASGVFSQVSRRFSLALARFCFVFTYLHRSLLRAILIEAAVADFEELDVSQDVSE